MMLRVRIVLVVALVAALLCGVANAYTIDTPHGAAKWEMALCETW